MHTKNTKQFHTPPPKVAGAHLRCPENILGWYTRGAMYIGRARGNGKMTEIHS